MGCGRRAGGSYDRNYRAGSSGRIVGTCNLFNDDPYSCTFGENCNFRHDCSICDMRGVVAKHPKVYCELANHFRPRGAHNGGGGAGQAGGRTQ